MNHDHTVTISAAPDGVIARNDRGDQITISDDTGCWRSDELILAAVGASMLTAARRYATEHDLDDSAPHALTIHGDESPRPDRLDLITPHYHFPPGAGGIDKDDVIRRGGNRCKHVHTMHYYTLLVVPTSDALPPPARAS